SGGRSSVRQASRGMRVVLSRFALAELDEILAYIANRSPLGAKNVEARFRNAFDLIGRHPRGGERIEQRPDVRRLSLVRYPYAVYDEIGADAVTVLRIMHGARQQPWRGGL
ncbi:MAG: type II toxin-antitoxin system RelE/ParE family toxin, partial [Fimbriimonadaceae bacterium]